MVDWLDVDVHTLFTIPVEVTVGNGFIVDIVVVKLVTHSLFLTMTL